MKKTLQLVQQQFADMHISIKHEESPVIVLAGSEYDYNNVIFGVGIAVNFLRSDCLSVQIFFGREPEDSNFLDCFKKLKTNTEKSLKFLSLPKESFKVEESGPVLLITRVIEK